MSDLNSKNARRISKTNGVPSRHDQAILSKEIGMRMRESRLMVGFSQSDSAYKLGYQNSTKLSKIEKGQSSAVPLWLIRRACIEYDVSADYLLGITETMERDDVSHASLRELHAFIFANFDRRHAQDIAMLVSLRKRLEAIEEFIVLSSMQMKQLNEAMECVEGNSEWQDLVGSNRLKVYMERLSHTLNSTSSKFKDIKREMQAKSGTEFQMNLLLEV